MAHPPTRPDPRRTVRDLSGKASLRVKLIAAVLVLVTAALAVISIAGITFLRGFLQRQADQQLHGLLNAEIPLGVERYLVSGRTQSANGPFSIQWLTASGKVRLVACEVTPFRYGQPTRLVPPPSVHPGDAWLSKTGATSPPVTVSATSGGGRWRVISFTEELPSPAGQPVKGTIVLGLDVTSVYRTLGELTAIDVIISCGLLVILTVVGIAVIRTSLRPLIDIERTAQAIAVGDLTRRVPEADPRTEVGRLGRSLNTMLAQIETAFRARTASEEAAHRSEEAARQSALAASRSEQRMRQFVADASHELRTPVTAIRGFAEYYRQRGGVADAADAADLEGGKLDHADLDWIIERVEHEATRMGVLVDDMLLLARLDQERTPEFRTVDLLAIAADALHDARVIAPDRSINLTVGTQDAALVIGDETGLRQVVSNLMRNAMTHTPDGTPIDITIRAGALASGDRPAGADGEPAVELEVSDRGPGLTEEQQEHVFERFYRTDRARSRTAGGTGLGLAIVAALVKAHHGRVWVESKPGEGSTFGFALPLAPEARPTGQ